MASFTEVQSAYVDFPNRVQSLMLSTISSEGQPQASYTPFVMERDRTVFIFVSGLSSHTQNLQTTPKAGILFIEDESQAKQVFARQRLMYDCSAELIERHDPQWTTWADKFKLRFGNLIDMLRQLPDFQIFKLTPQAGRFVVGFGAAYEVDPTNLDRLMPTEN
ncbi:pyridoxamine 5'-phosphate oxidase family protein [Oscillatoria sp. CS-180]|uniref:HugZ family pyridoxamine 5'-phosphate oxidase n=1 Tax=Oscillatoria sp. CS-180 TaxID=3021720 RepID=UPI00232B55B5|nr:pyridoxamine 5'-phosphate oxidase family protein [Oscillatoria sp. CS-180]MDB9525497.1 pyridoxamine 5'-phosphate oxidase family protein [Oscillatoria sp. CS-180]